MHSLPTNHLTKPNNKQQTTKNNNPPYKSAYSYRYLRYLTYFKRARVPLSYYQT